MAGTDLYYGGVHATAREEIASDSNAQRSEPRTSFYSARGGVVFQGHTWLPIPVNQYDNTQKLRSFDVVLPHYLDVHRYSALMYTTPQQSATAAIYPVTGNQYSTNHVTVQAWASDYQLANSGYGGDCAGIDLRVTPNGGWGLYPDNPSSNRTTHQFVIFGYTRKDVLTTDGRGNVAYRFYNNKGHADLWFPCLEHSSNTWRYDANKVRSVMI